MDKNKAIEQIRSLQTSDDPETAHMAADGILLDLLANLGMDDVVSAYRETREVLGFWYA